MSAVVPFTGADLFSLRHSYERDIDWKLEDPAIFKEIDGANENYLRNEESGGILYKIPSLNNWSRLVCDPKSKYYSDSTTLLNDIYDCITSASNTELSSNILQLIIECCSGPFYNFISMNSLIHKISVNDDHRRNNEYAFNVLNNGKESWNKWYNGSWNRWRKGIPNSNVLIIAFYFEIKVIINRYMIETANDYNDRDPYKWILYGENLENILANKDKEIKNVIHHHTGKKDHLCATRWGKNWYDIDTENVYSYDDQKMHNDDGYDIYILAIYENLGKQSHHFGGNDRATQIGQIQFECIDESKKFLYDQFDLKMNQLIKTYNKKGMSIQEIEQYFKEKKIIITNDDQQN